MNDTSQRAGLCPACHWVRRVVSGRGSQFLRCGLSDVEPGFDKYPRVPVLSCRGFRAAGQEPSEDVPDRTGREKR